MIFVRRFRPPFILLPKEPLRKQQRYHPTPSDVVSRADLLCVRRSETKRPWAKLRWQMSYGATVSLASIYTLRSKSHFIAQGVYLRLLVCLRLISL
jgi:hypothetical protein